MIRIGCCGFCTAQGRYFEIFDCIEVQKTFYSPPGIETLKKWNHKAPEGFIFTIKAWQLITHTPASPTYRRLKTPVPEEKRDRYGSFKPTEEVFKAWEVTAECARALDADFIVFQMPASFKAEEKNINNMRVFFENINRYGFKLGFEPRGNSWTEGRIRKICSEFDLIDVVDPFVRLPVYGDVFYFRLHGRGGYRYRYTDDDLKRLREISSNFGEGFVMFNNVYMLEDALRFKRIVDGE